MILCPRCKEACGGRCALIRRPSRRHFFFGLLGGAVATQAAVQYTAGGFFGGDANIVWNALASKTPLLRDSLRISVDAVFGSPFQMVATVFDLQGNIAGSAKVENGGALITLDRPLQLGGFRIGLKSAEPFKFYSSRVILSGDGRSEA